MTILKTKGLGLVSLLIAQGGGCNLRGLIYPGELRINSIMG